VTVTRETLNGRFAHVPGLAFKEGPGGLTVAEITNPHAHARIALQGGHVLAFQPVGQKPILWVSRHSQYAAGTPIRGGIPVCWPWFGQHPVDAQKPPHGFARISPWTVLDAVAEDTTRLWLGLSANEATRSLWPHDFQVELTVTIGRQLEVELTIRNPGPSAFTCTSALHSYFAISDVAKSSVNGLDGCVYLDKVAGYERREQTGPIAFTGETDRIYLDTTTDCVIEDAGWERAVRVAKRGSRSTVVWNPWADRARQLADFGDEEYREMLCVETANAADDAITVAPLGTHRLAAIVSVE
jgi:glucose-6-phosphate 1-epimerase